MSLDHPILVEYFKALDLRPEQAVWVFAHLDDDASGSIRGLQHHPPPLLIYNRGGRPIVQ